MVACAHLNSTLKGCCIIPNTLCTEVFSCHNACPRWPRGTLFPPAAQLEEAANELINVFDLNEIPRNTSNDYPLTHIVSTTDLSTIPRKGPGLEQGLEVACLFASQIQSACLGILIALATSPSSCYIDTPSETTDKWIA